MGCGIVFFANSKLYKNNCFPEEEIEQMEKELKEDGETSYGDFDFYYDDDDDDD